MAAAQPSVQASASGILRDSKDAHASVQRVVIVSSRLPVTLNLDKAPPHDVEESSSRSGGLDLASALRRCSDDSLELVWVGWPGAAVPEQEQARYTARLNEESGRIRCVPVWLTEVEADQYFSGFCNSSLWPLLHWMTPYACFKAEWSECYKKVNELFATAVLDVVKRGDLIWVQDYHLLLLPKLLREYFAGFDDVTVDSTASTEAGPPRISRSQTEASMFSAPEDRLQIAFFLHTPFPGYEIVSVHPLCMQLLEGVLGADLIGFQTYGYVRHFRSTVTRVCGYHTELDRIDHHGERTKLGVFPVGVNAEGVLQAMRTERFAEHLREYTEQFQGKSLVLAVERLDYSKGLPQRLAAIRRYLEDAEQEVKEAQRRAVGGSAGGAGGASSSSAGGTHAAGEEGEEESRGRGDGNGRERRRSSKDHIAVELAQMREEKKKKLTSFNSLFRLGASWAKAWTQKRTMQDNRLAVFVLIAVPAKHEAMESKALEEEVHRTISEINGRFSTPTHLPIVYIRRAISMEELTALYARADAMLVTPLIDGLNLMAKEFLVAKDRAVQKVNPGVVIISELAGAAQELFDALVVNPHNELAVAEAISFALELSEFERWDFTEAMRREVLKGDDASWARHVLEALQKSAPAPLARCRTKELPDSEAMKFRSSQYGTKALFLDYDGTLQEIVKRPEDAIVSKQTRAIMAALNQREDLRVSVISGRDADFLDRQLGGYENFTLVGEHGYHIRRPGEKWQRFNPHAVTTWKEKVEPVMQLFAKSTPGSHIEKHKTSSIVWHYRGCDERYGEFKAKELVHLLSQSLANLPCQISQGHKIVEVTSLQVTKGTVLLSSCHEFEQATGQGFEAVLVMGDDRTDESMFVDAMSLNSCRAVTVKVGDGETHAHYRVPDPNAVRRFLSFIAMEDTLPPAVQPPAVPRQNVSCPGFVQRDRSGPMLVKLHSVPFGGFGGDDDSPRAPVMTAT